jgi:hypothetical protein
MKKTITSIGCLFLLNCVVCGVASAAPVITTNLLVDLNGDSTANFLTNGLSPNSVQVWYDAAHDGNAANQQDYGLSGTLTTRMPSLVAATMPNGRAISIVDFNRGTVTGSNSGSSTSDYLESKVGGDARQTTFGGTFNQGADSAYSNLTGLSWFSVVRTDLVTTTADGGGSSRQMIIRSNHSDSTTRWGSYFLDSAAGAGGDLSGDDVIPEIQSAVRDGALPSPGNQTHWGPDAQAAAWYIVANSYDAPSGVWTSRFLDQFGNDTGLLTRTITADLDGIGAHALTSIGRLSTSPSDTGGNFLDGQIAELLIYNSALSDSNLGTVVNYLNEKYFVATTKTWNSTTTTDWAMADNWSASGLPGAPGPTDHVVFRSGTATVNSVDLNGAARSAGSLTFNSNQTNFQVTGLSLTNTLTIDSPSNSTTTPDISVTSGNAVIHGSATLSSFDSAATGDILLAGINDSDWFVVDVASGASLDIQASMSSTSTAGRRAHFVKQGEGVLTLSSVNQIDMRPQTSGVVGGVYVDAGTLQLAAYGAKGNPFAPYTVASGATLEFKGTGFQGSFFGPGLSEADNNNRSVLTINGNGVGGVGAIYNSVGNNLLASSGNSSNNAASSGLSSGLIVVASDSSIGVATGTTLTLSHGIYKDNAYFYVNTPGGSGSGVAAGKLTKVGQGTLIFDANNDTARNGYASEIIVNEGKLLVTSPTTASARTGAEMLTAATIVLPNVGDTAGLHVGQPVTITNTVSGSPSIATNAVIAGIGTDGRTFRVSEAVTGFGAGVIADLSFGAVTSALSTSPVTVNNGGTFGGTGSVLGSNVTVNAGGILAPGTSIGTFTVGSAIIAGTLAIEFNGGSIDKLIVAGALDISGATLAFTNLGALTGSVHVIAQYGSLAGNPFTTITGLPSGYALDYNYLSGNQIALVASAHPGDFDSDGDVDGADFVAWQTNFPKANGATLAQGDADGDGDVDGADFVVWQTNFPFTPGPGTSPVPEPTGVALAAIGLTLGWGLRRSNRRRK